MLRLVLGKNQVTPKRAVTTVQRTNPLILNTTVKLTESCQSMDSKLKSRHWTWHSYHSLSGVSCSPLPQLLQRRKLRRKLSTNHRFVMVITWLHSISLPHRVLKKRPCDRWVTEERGGLRDRLRSHTIKSVRRLVPHSESARAALPLAPRCSQNVRLCMKPDGCFPPQMKTKML